jgi:hypothetical protein
VQGDVNVADNELRKRIKKAAVQADTSLEDLRHRGTAPLGSTLATLESAWTSPSPERRRALDDLAAAASAVAGAFRAQSSHAWAEWRDEPPEIDDEDEAHAWKIDGWRIDARSHSPYPTY